MRKLLGASFLVLMCFAIPAFAQKSGTKAPASNVAQSALPVTRVVLYKNGIGYFEHSAKVEGSEDLHIDFTTGQLNDVLASLTATDLGDGHVTSVRFNSIAPLSQRLRALHLPLGANTTRQQFLDALRGTRVEIESGSASVTGKVLSVESVTRTIGTGPQSEQVLVLSVVTDDGAFRSFDLGPGVSVRIANHELEGDISQYLDLIGSERAADVRRMTITDDGTGERTVYVSYISEVPVWKSSYRILLTAGEKPLIQGWAIVDNTLGEDWNNIQLSLVSGAPQSFIENLAVPYYLQRPVVPLPHSVLLTPQTHEEALESYAKIAPGVVGGVASGALGGLQGGTASLQGRVTDATGAAIAGAQVTVTSNLTGASRTIRTDDDGRYSFSGLPQGSYKIVIRSLGFNNFESGGNYLYSNRTAEANATLRVGSVAQTVEVRAAAMPAAPPSPAFLAQKIESEQPQATGRGVAELFEYDIKNRVTIGRNQSALVPILQSRLDAEKVTLWNANETVPLRALWLSNTTGLTLDAGTFNVIDDGTFAGEGLFDTIRDGDKRLVSYAADPAVQVSTKQGSSLEPVTRIVIAKGLMTTTREERSTETYRVSNSDTKPRTVVIESPVRSGWKLSGEAKPDETTADYYRFKVDVKPKESSKLVVEQVRHEYSQTELTNLTSNDVVLLVRQKTLTPQMEAAFRKILAQKTALAAIDDQIQSRQRDIQNISNDQTRIRENMKALKGGTEEKQLLARYVRELNSQEDRLAALRSQIAGLKTKRDAAAAELDRTIEGISMDQTF